MLIVRRTRRALVFALAMSLYACGPQQPHGGGHGAHLFGMHRGALPLVSHALRLGLRGTRQHGFRRACADDVARLCASARTRREERQCLQGKQNSLSADCRAALNRRREPERER